VLVAGSRRKAPEPVILPPLVVYSARRRYHPEVEGIFSNFFRERGTG
jgi:tRNA1(Val) A37 N6-methylase TrmN6